MKTDSLSTALNDIINSKISKNFFTSITSKRIYSYLDKDIVIGTSADGLAMVFKDEDLVKMAIGIIDDKDGNAIPLLALGAGSGNGDNRGYISKGTDGIEMYYVGDLSAGEVGGLKLTKDGVYATNQIVVDPGLAGEFTIDATYWNAKLNELDVQDIVENPAKAWDIPKENILDTDVSYWNGGGSENGASSAAATAIQDVIDLASDLQLDAPLPTDIKMDASGITATATGDSTKYARLDYRGLYINNGALLISNNTGNTMISGTGIKAEYIEAGTMTGQTIQTGVSGSERLVLSSAGIKSYNTAGDLNGWVWDSGNFSDFSAYYNNTKRGGLSQVGNALFLAATEGSAGAGGCTLTLSSDHSNIYVRPGTGNSDSFGTTYFYGTTNFTNATCTGLTAVWG